MNTPLGDAVQAFADMILELHFMESEKIPLAAHLKTILPVIRQAEISLQAKDATSSRLLDQFSMRHLPSSAFEEALRITKERLELMKLKMAKIEDRKQ